MKRLISFILCVTVALSLTSCSFGGVKKKLTDPDLTYSMEELEELQTRELKISDYELPALYKYFEGKCRIGVVTDGYEYTNYETDDRAKGILKNYNAYVLENAMKPDHCNPAPGVYDFDAADAFVKTGELGSAELRAHTVVWHSQVPEWWFKADPEDTGSVKECYKKGRLATREQLEERLRTYIDELVPRYKNTVKYWDVVNEAISDNDNIIKDHTEKSYWSEIFGDVDGDGYYDDYIEYAFNTVREVGGDDLVLMINDYYMEWDETKTQKMYDTVERMLRKGVRIDGVGFQSHIGSDIDIDIYRKNLEKISGLSKIYDECFPEYKGNFRIQITELEMNMRVGELADAGFHPWSDEDYAYQADVYYRLFDMLMDFADQGIIDLILFWGTDDGHSWINSDLKENAPLLVDRKYRVKPAYWAVARAAIEHSGK